MWDNTFVIASIGFEDKDQALLLSLAALAKERVPSFVLFESQNKQKYADILLVNADDSEAVIKWNKYLKKFGEQGTITSMMFTIEPPTNSTDKKNRYINRPISATKLLAILEEEVLEKHGYKPPDVLDGELTVTDANLPKAGKNKNGNNAVALVVDDSLPVRIQMKKALEMVNCGVEFSETGEEAAEKLKNNNYDIVFLDVILPGMDGYDICKLIKKAPETSATPVIMLTSNSSPADRIKGKMAGCDTYLIKPVNADIFKEVIYEYLDLE